MSEHDRPVDQPAPPAPPEPQAAPTPATAAAAPAITAVGAAPAPAAPASKPQKDSWKDTFESIAIALILAFVFRAFVVEAFVIPTGSMASTLLGKHYEIYCDNCGFGPWNLSIPKDDEGGSGNQRASSQPQPDPVCPNCNHHIRQWNTDGEPLVRPAPKPSGGDEISGVTDEFTRYYAGLPDRMQEVRGVLRRSPQGAFTVDDSAGATLVRELPGTVGEELKSDYRARIENRLSRFVGRTVRVRGKLIGAPGSQELLPEWVGTDGPPAHGGDRILVLKYLYEFAAPRRWDVVVFRFPGNPKENYIKRMVGLPGESIMIVDGDVYVSKDRGATWEIARKPLDAPKVQETLWHLVHTADFPPKTGDYLPATVRMVKKWETSPGSAGWSGLEDRVFKFDSPDAGPQGIRYVQYLNPNFDRYGAGARAAAPAPRENVPIFDAHPYNGVGGFSQGSESPSSIDNLRIVSDLKFSADLVWQGGDGYFQAALTKYGDRFTARFHADGKVQLFRSAHDKEPAADAAPVETAPAGKPPAGRPVAGELFNSDHVVEVRVGGATVIQYKYEVAELKLLLSGSRKFHDPKFYPRVEAAGGNARFELRHVRIDRDIFYTQEPNKSTNRATMNHPIELSSGSPTNSREYFVMGDNSAASSDGRFWDDPNAYDPRHPDRFPKGRKQYQPGTVPEENLTGKAFFVYWPSGFTLFGDRFELVPRAGKWRLIH